MNNYKILKRQKNKNYFFFVDNNINSFKANSNGIKYLNDYLIKLLIVLLFIVLIRLEKLNYNLNELEQNDEDDFIKIENEQKIQKSLLSHDFFNITFLKNEMHYYSLYNSFYFPKISLVIMNQNNNHTYISEIIKLIDNLIDTNHFDFEIILYFESLKRKEYKLIKDKYKKIINHNMFIIDGKIEDKYDNYYEIINIVRGLYTIFINDINLLNNINTTQIFNNTIGKIDQYFNITTSNHSSLYLFKSKILKDFNDNGIVFYSLNNIIDKFESIIINNINYIHISFCPNNRYTSLAFVSMSSILSTKSINSFICFYLIIPSDFDIHNIDFLETLYEQYEFFNITYIKMDDRYDKSYTDSRITKQAYYRFSLGELLPNLNKIIYLDTDTIIYKDLYNFYNTNFNGKMILGQATYGNGNAEKKGYHRINTGVLLLNLNEMRKNKFEKKVIEIINKGKKLRYHDQTLLNDNFKQHLGLFPPEYHTRPWSNYKEMCIFNKKIGKIYNNDYFYFVNKYPTIRHYLGRYKPLYPKINQIEDWWFYARKSKYYNSNTLIYTTAFSY